MKKYKIIAFILFALVLYCTGYWKVVELFFSSISESKPPVSIIENKYITKLINGKTGISIKNIKISESERPFGMMIGIPSAPQLFLSRALYNSFTPDELEYVVLHEAGHYKLNHSLYELIAGIILLVIGIYILSRIKYIKLLLPSTLILAFLFGILMIQLGRMHEIEADNFAVKRLTNPVGMITSTKKFKTENQKEFIKLLFHRSNPYENRIKMAEEEINRRLSK